MGAVLSIGAVASIVIGWGVAQRDYMLPTSLTVSAAAAPSGTLQARFAATVLFVLVVVPGFVLLYTLHQKSLLPGARAIQNDILHPVRATSSVWPSGLVFLKEQVDLVHGRLLLGHERFQLADLEMCVVGHGWRLRYGRL